MRTAFLALALVMMAATSEAHYLLQYVETNCHEIHPPNSVIILDERFVTVKGSDYSPESCKGGICWTWKARSDPFEWVIFSSNLPIRLFNTERVSQNLTIAVRQTESLRKSSSSTLNTMQSFLHSAFSGGTERGIGRERSMTLGRTQDQALETEVTPLFHTFLAKGIQGPITADYPFCISSAADLVLKARNFDRLDSLVGAFVIYRTIRPEDIELSPESSVITRAKYLFLHYPLYPLIVYDPVLRDFMWAQSVLFATLLDWPEFSEVKAKVEEEMKKAYERYSTLLKLPTIEIQDEKLAMRKYAVDKELYQRKAQENEYRDRYAHIVAYEPLDESELKELKESYEQALKAGDELLKKRFVSTASGGKKKFTKKTNRPCPGSSC